MVTTKLKEENLLNLMIAEPRTSNELGRLLNSHHATIVRDVLNLMATRGIKIRIKKIGKAEIFYINLLDLIDYLNISIAELPEELQNIVIKQEYPEIPIEGWIYLKLYNKKAFFKNKAVDVKESNLTKQEKPVFDEEVEVGNIKEVNGKFYLSPVAKMIAEEAKKVYLE